MKDTSSRVSAIEAAEYLSRITGISVRPRTLHSWAEQDKCPYHRIVGRLVFDLTELQAWVDASRGGPGLPTVYAGTERPS